MEESNSLDNMITEEEEEDTDEPISLNDLRLMYAKLQEIRETDVTMECELRRKLKELKSKSILKRVTLLQDKIKEMKDRIDATKEENKILSAFSLDGFADNQGQILGHLSIPADFIRSDVTRLFERTSIFNDLTDRSKSSSVSQTDLTFPPSFSTLDSFTLSSAGDDDKPFNAQDAFIEIQLDRKRQLEDRLKYLKKHMWFEGPDVMLIKLDDYEKMITKLSIRRRKRLKLNSNSYDGYLKLTDNSEKRPCLETSSASSASSQGIPSSSSNINNKNALPKMNKSMVERLLTASPKQTNGQGSQKHSGEDSTTD